MAELVPLKAVYNGSNVCGLSELRDGDVVGVEHGGLGVCTLAANSLLIGNTQGSVTTTSALTNNGQIIIGGTSGPTVANLSGTSNEVDITNGDGTIQIGLPAAITITASIKSPAICVSSQYALPAADGSAGQIMCTDGSGALSFVAFDGSGHCISFGGSTVTDRTCLNFLGGGVTVSDNSGTNATDITIPVTTPELKVRNVSGTELGIQLDNTAIGGELICDTTPQLGGTLDVNGFAISSASDGNIAITPHGDGAVVLDGLSWPIADGTAGYILCTNGSGSLAWAADASGQSVAGSNTQLQFNNSGDFGASANLTFDGTILKATGDLCATVKVVSPALCIGSEYALPTADGSAGQIMCTNGSGALAFATAAAGVTLAGSTNNTIATVTGSDALAGEANLTFDGSTLAITGTATIDDFPVVNSYGPYGTGDSGAVSNITDADFNATTVAQTGTVTTTSNRIIRATSTVTLSHAITVSKQNGQARGLYPSKQGGPGIPLGDTLAAVGSKGIPVPIRPGGDNTSLMGGILQILASGNVVVGSTITAVGTNTTSDGGGGGGLVIIVSGGTISGSGAIDVSGGAGNSTGNARGGAGSYSAEPGGHSGVAGAGGGGYHDGFGPVGGGGSGEGIINAYGGGTAPGHGGGGGSVDDAGDGGDGADGGLVVRGMNKLAGGWAIEWTASTDGGGSTHGTGGAYGGGGGGGFWNSSSGHGGDAGSGGGGAGGNGGQPGGTAGNGADGAAGLYVVSSYSPYAGGAGGQGGGGAGDKPTWAMGSHGQTRGAGAAGHTHGDLFKTGSGTTAESGHGGGAGGQGVGGGTGTVRKTGGDGGNGGGAAGLVLMIAPSITYSGTVTGRHVKIEGTDFQNFIKGLLQYG